MRKNNKSLTIGTAFRKNFKFFFVDSRHEQMLYFVKFFDDQCLFWKASSLASEKMVFVVEKFDSAYTDEEIPFIIENLLVW